MQTCIHTYIHTYIHTCTCIHEHIWKDDLFDKYILISLHVQTNLECFLLFIRLAGCKIICLIDFHMRIFVRSKSSQCLRDKAIHVMQISCTKTPELVDWPHTAFITKLYTYLYIPWIHLTWWLACHQPFCCRKKKKVQIIRLWPDKAMIHVAAHTHYPSQACLL